MDIEQLADACGGLAWISERLFEVEGRLATSSGVDGHLDARTQVLLARSSRRYGQHAQWWRAALPDSPSLDGPGRVCPPSDSWSRLLEFVESEDWIGALSGLYGIALPELINLVDQMRVELSPISDGAVLRIARIVKADLDEERADAEWVLTTVPAIMFQSLAWSSERAAEVWKGPLDASAGVAGE